MSITVAVYLYFILFLVLRSNINVFIALVIPTNLLKKHPNDFMVHLLKLD